ncbi:hypothetical protein [Lacunimicrobium album]
MSLQPDVNSALGVRLRPAMYVGGRDYFGFIQYLVCAVEVHLNHGATWIDVVGGETIRVASDALLPVRVLEGGEVEPFDRCRLVEGNADQTDATILAGLSRELTVCVDDGREAVRGNWKEGVRVSFERGESGSGVSSLELVMVPDQTIFSTTTVSPAALRSYLRRMSFLHSSRRFRLVLGDQPEEYFQTDGIAGLFDAMITPFQVLHQPIHFRMGGGDLDLEVIFVFHSWHQDHVWSFANHGRVPEGGPHHQGFLKAIRRLRKKLGVTPGVLGLLSLMSDKLVYKGCIKEKLGDPTLAERVAKLTGRGIEEWMSSHGGETFETLETFQFAENWYGMRSSGG